MEIALNHSISPELVDYRTQETTGFKELFCTSQDKVNELTDKLARAEEIIHRLKNVIAKVNVDVHEFNNDITINWTLLEGFSKEEAIECVCDLVRKEMEKEEY